MPLPSTEVPSTLTPIRRGAVIDWKATALQEHDDFIHAKAQASILAQASLRQKAEIEQLNRQLVDAYDLTAKHFAKLAAIRAHWSAFLLPTHLR